MPAQIRALLADLGALLAGISLLGELSPRSRDFLVSFGERLSVRIAEMYFNSTGINAKAFDAWELGLVSDDNWTSAELLDESHQNVSRKLAAILQEGILPIVTGFIAKSKSGSITTLGRGGSDLTATYIAASCGAEEVQVWKDVDGIMTFDPRIIKTAQPVANVTYEEAAELAYFGAQVLHPRAMLPCSKTHTPVLVKNSYNPAAPGTRISAKLDKSAAPVRALTNELSRIAHVEAKSNKAIVTIVCDVCQSSRILERTFAVCDALGVHVQMISQGASKVNISFIVNESEAIGLISGLHKEFFETADSGGQRVSARMGQT